MSGDDLKSGTAQLYPQGFLAVEFTLAEHSVYVFGTGFGGAPQAFAVTGPMITGWHVYASMDEVIRYLTPERSTAGNCFPADSTGPRPNGSLSAQFHIGTHQVFVFGSGTDGRVQVFGLIGPTINGWQLYSSMDDLLAGWF